MAVIKSEIRDRIISAARKVFSRKGYRQTTMDDIAGVCKMGKSSIYYYYKSKEEIFEDVVIKEAQELKRELLKVIQSNKRPEERLKDYILFRLYHVKAVSNFYAVIKKNYHDQMKFVNRVRKKFEEEEYKMVRDILNTGIKQRAFVMNNPDIGAIAFTTMLKGLELPLFLKDYTRAEKEELLDELIEVIFYGLIKRD
ncbi:MAG: TetR/AcrR family transcriptional regulator [Bacteroidales bacterium]|nr:TetR/AcrR family transcriptional regulator [Bacteroidales bacterium]